MAQMTPSLFQSDHFTYRPLEQQDREHFIGLYGDLNVMEKIMPPLTKAQALSLFDVVADSHKHLRAHFWTIVSKDTSTILGVMGFLPCRSTGSVKEVEFGILLYPQHQGHHVAPEAIHALLNHGFEHLSVDVAFACFSSKNTAVAKVAQRLNIRFTPQTQKQGAMRCEISKQEYQQQHL